VAVLKKETTVQKINQAFIDASNDPKYAGAISVCDKPLVSADFRGNPSASIIDLLSTQVVDGDLVKVLSWYDNELGYSYRLAEFCRYVENRLSQE